MSRLIFVALAALCLSACGPSGLDQQSRQKLVEDCSGYLRFFLMLPVSPEVNHRVLASNSEAPGWIVRWDDVSTEIGNVTIECEVSADLENVRDVRVNGESMAGG